MKTIFLAGVAALSVLSASAAHAQTNGTLTLACQGTTTQSGSEPEPISVGVIINFTKGTVDGLANLPLAPSTVVNINNTDETTVSFVGTDKTSPLGTIVLRGTIDRITGNLEAYNILFTANKAEALNSLELKCKPAQRMF